MDTGITRGFTRGFREYGELDLGDADLEITQCLNCLLSKSPCFPISQFARCQICRTGKLPIAIQRKGELVNVETWKSGLGGSDHLDIWRTGNWKYED